MNDKIQAIIRELKDCGITAVYADGNLTVTTARNAGTLAAIILRLHGLEFDRLIISGQTRTYGGVS